MPTSIRQAVDWSIGDTSRRLGQEISSWPDGTYEADVFVDSDPAGNQDIKVHVAVTVEGDHLIVDFDGSDVRPEIQAWSTYGNTRGNVISQLASMVDPSIPKNEGFFDRITLHAPVGSCVNPAEGKPVSSGTHHPGVEVSDVIAVALSAGDPGAVRARRPTSSAVPARCGATSTRAPAARSSTTAARSPPVG